MNTAADSPIREPLAAIETFANHIFERSSSAKRTQDNSITCLLNSEENFPAWLEAMQQAQHSIAIEMYIFSADLFGQQVRSVLLEKLQQGVQVFLIYDWLGSIWAHYRGFFRPLLAAGAQIRPYNKIGLTTGISLLSRNHRKSIIVDERLAFVSGLCISAQWNGNEADGISPWRDTGVKLTGSIVAQVNAAFADTWAVLGSPMPQNNPHRVEPTDATATDSNGTQGSAAARVVATTPADANMMRLDLIAISLARKNLWITDAYFMPTRLYVQALINAAKDGVDVRLLVPRTSDIRWIGTVSRTQYRQLLEAGVRVFEWNGSMIHAKMSAIDGQWARVGSTNLNLSSWFANRELDVAIEDPQTVHYLEQCFLKDLENSTEVILNEQNYAQLKQQRQKQHLKMRQHWRRQNAHTATRHMLHWSHAFDAAIHGTRIVDESEAWAYLSIGLVILLLCILLFFAPKILVYPLLLLLLIGGGATTAHAVKLLRQFRQAKPDQAQQPDQNPF